MRKPFRIASVTAPAIALFLVSASPGSAAVIPGWYSSTDLSAVVATGNSDTINVGATVNLKRLWLRTSWTTTASFQRNDVREPQLRAVGTSPGAFTIDKGDWIAKSEKLFANTNFERRITERFFWNVGGTGERDKFAGLSSRLTGFGGVGYMWQSAQGDGSFKTGVAATFTQQEEVIDDPETEDSFAGVRFTAEGEKRFGSEKQHVFSSNLIMDENAQDTEDLRANWQTSLAAALSQRLAIKIGAVVGFDNQPQLIETDLISAVTGESIGQVVTPAKKVDTTFTVSLVINFQPGGRAGRPTP